MIFEPFQKYPNLTILCIVSLTLLIAIYLLGNFLAQFFVKKEELENKSLTAILLGFIALSSLAAISIFGFKTIFIPILIVLAIGLLVRAYQNKFSQTLKIPTSRLDISFLLIGFSIFFFLRIFSLYNFETGLWNLMLKDDNYYVELINYILYFKTEGVPYELNNKEFGYPYYYQPYHYISFVLGAILKKIGLVNSFQAFHFFICPFFQTLGFFALHKTSVRITKKPLISFFIAMAFISMLRYGIWDEALYSLIPMEILKTNITLMNFLGFQFINSGFGFKFCFTLLLFGVFIENIKNGSPLILSVYMLLNPIYIVLNMWMALILTFFSRARFLEYVHYLLATFFLLMSFGLIMNSVQTSPDLAIVLNNLNVFLSKGLPNYIFGNYGFFIHNFYNILLFPSILVLLNRNNLIEKVFALSFISSILYQELFSNKYFSLAFFIYTSLCITYIVHKNHRNKLFIIYFSSGFLFFLGSDFALLVTDLNQIFLFTMYCGFIYLGVSIYSKFGTSLFWTLIAAALTSQNFILNYNESKSRSVIISKDNLYLDKISVLLTKYNIKKSCYYDDDCIYPFFNQFYIGEEISQVTDSLFSTSLKIPKLANAKDKSQVDFLQKIPLAQFINQSHQKSDTLHLTQQFMDHFDIGLLTVRDKDKSKISHITSLFSDSIHNEQNKYTLYFRSSE